MKYPFTFSFGGVGNRLREDRNPAKNSDSWSYGGEI